jgi:hypothetical protein
MTKPNYRIQTADGRFRFAGTDQPSWLTLETARTLVNYETGERIVEHNGVNVLWEVF